MGPDILKASRPRRIDGCTLGETIFSSTSLEQGSTPSLPSRVCRPKEVRPPSAFLELFAGTAGLSQAVEKAGLRVLPPFEVSNGSQFNLLDEGVQLVVLGLIKGRHVWWIHLGTPCTAWSRARKLKMFCKGP